MKMILRIPHHHLIKMMKANLRQILKNKNLEVKSILAMMISIHLMELKSRKERMERNLLGEMMTIAQIWTSHLVKLILNVY